MSKPQEPSARQRLSPAQRSNLVAYLDQELQQEENQDLEQVLVHCQTARRDLEVLTRTWEMLDLLPHPDLDTAFSTQILHQVQSEAKHRHTRGAKWFVLGNTLRFYVLWVFSLALAFTLSFWAVYYWPNPDRNRINDLPIYERLSVYQQIDNRDVLEDLQRQTGLFRADQK